MRLMSIFASRQDGARRRGARISAADGPSAERRQPLARESRRACVVSSSRACPPRARHVPARGPNVRHGSLPCLASRFSRYLLGVFDGLMRESPREVTRGHVATRRSTTLELRDRTRLPRKDWIITRAPARRRPRPRRPLVYADSLARRRVSGGRRGAPGTAVMLPRQAPHSYAYGGLENRARHAAVVDPNAETATRQRRQQRRAGSPSGTPG
jgi:hypothetical protein